MGTSLIRTETVHYGNGSGVELEVQCSTLLIELAKRQLRSLLEGKITEGQEYVESYIASVTQTNRNQGLGFELPPSYAGLDDHLTAFAAFLRLPSDLIATWFEALNRVDKLPDVPKVQSSEGGASKDPKSEGNVSSSSSA